MPKDLGQMTDLPIVSVIVPCYNESGKVASFIEAIFSQTYPKDKIDLIVVDNGSTDGTYQQLKKYNNFSVLNASKRQSPYYARNYGMKEAKGEILALLDMNKIPSKDWMKKGVSYFLETGADLIAGNIEFEPSSDLNIYELMDTIMYFDNKNLIQTSKACAAGNLLFKREVWEQIGDFPELRSGMDMLWTKRATNKGFKLHYVDDLKVVTYARGKQGLLKKSFRVGTGHPYMWRKDEVNVIKILLIIGKNFIPPSPRRLKNKIARRNIELYDRSFLKLYLLFYLNQIMVGLGRVLGLKELFRT